MKVISDLSQIQKNFSLVIGNFDGVHIGHQKILEEFQLASKKEGLKTCLLTFLPHPAFVLEGKKHFLLQTYQEKKEKIAKLLNIDFYMELPFDEEMALLDGKTFFETYVWGKTHLKKIFPGHDFCLGSKRNFHYEDLEKLFHNTNTEIQRLNIYKKNEKRVSSTLIRNHLVNGEIEEANTLLGEEFTISGEVVHGFKNGRKINSPTVNLSLTEEKILPKTGVYKTFVMFKEKKFKAVTNIGRRPTVGNFPIAVETFILNFSEEIYGEKITVGFLDFLREEKKFSNINELKTQIQKDIKKAWEERC